MPCAHLIQVLPRIIRHQCADRCHGVRHVLPNSLNLGLRRAVLPFGENNHVDQRLTPRRVNRIVIGGMSRHHTTSDVPAQVSYSSARVPNLE